MFSKRTIIGGIVAFVVLFLVNWLLWGLIFMGTWENMTQVEMTTDPSLLWLALGYLVIGWMMAFIYPKGYGGGSPAAEGFRFGVVAWAIASFGPGLGIQGFMPDSMTAFLFGSFVNLIGYAVTGIAMAMVMKGQMEPMRTPTAAAPPATPTPPPMPEEGGGEGQTGEF